MTISKKQEILIVIFFLLIFSFFIFSNINLSTFWLDEAATANLLPLSYVEILHKAIADSHPLFYIFSLKTWSIFFGQSEIALRLFSAFFALALLCSVYLFCRRWFDKKIAILALALTSLNYFLIWFSNENRPYTLAAFLGLLSYYFFLEIIENQKKKWIILYILITVCGLYTHPWFYFIYGSQILGILFWHRDKIKLLIYQAYILLFAIPGMLIFFYQRNLGVNSWIDKPNINDLLSSFNYFSSNHIWIYIIISLFVLSIIIYKEEDWKINRFQTKILFLYFFIPLILIFIISQYSPIYFAGRYEIILLPAFIILISILWSRINFSILIVIFIILFGLVNRSVFEKKNYIISQKSNDKTIVNEVMNRVEKNDLIITTDLSWSTVYYYTFRSTIKKDISLQSFPKEIESHPGWENIKAMNLRKEIYEKEAIELIKKIENNEKIKQIWVFYQTNNEINPFLIKELEKKFGSAEIIMPDLPRQPSWFDSVYLFKK